MVVLFQEILRDLNSWGIHYDRPLNSKKANQTHLMPPFLLHLKGTFSCLLLIMLDYVIRYFLDWETISFTYSCLRIVLNFDLTNMLLIWMTFSALITNIVLNLALLMFEDKRTSVVSTFIICTRWFLWFLKFVALKHKFSPFAAFTGTKTQVLFTHKAKLLSFFFWCVWKSCKLYYSASLGLNSLYWRALCSALFLSYLGCVWELGQW